MATKQYCIKGHDTYKHGRNSTGHCKFCQAERVSARRWSYAKIIYKNRPFTIVDYDYEYQRQQGRCKICGKHQSEITKRLAADHDHLTFQFRGLICSQPCNALVVKLVENYPELIEAAKLYLLETSEHHNDYPTR